MSRPKVPYVSAGLVSPGFAASCVEMVEQAPGMALSLYSVQRGPVDVAIVVARTPEAARALRMAYRALDNGHAVVPKRQG